MVLHKQLLIEVHIDFKKSILNLIQISLTNFLFLVVSPEKRIAQVYFFLGQIIAVCFWQAKIKNKKIVRLIWFKVPVTCMTLHTAHCTMYSNTAPEPVPPPEFAPVHFILHIEQCTVQTTQLYCMLHSYQELAEFKLKWRLSEHQCNK